MLKAILPLSNNLLRIYALCVRARTVQWVELYIEARARTIIGFHFLHSRSWQAVCCFGSISSCVYSLLIHVCVQEDIDTVLVVPNPRGPLALHSKHSRSTPQFSVVSLRTCIIIQKLSNKP